MQADLLREISREEYSTLFKESREPSLLQSPAWPEIKRDWAPRRFVYEREGRPRALAQLLLRPFPLGQKLAYLALGPMLLSVGEEGDRLACLAALATELKRDRGCFLFKVQPPVLRKVFPLGEEEPEADEARDHAFLSEMRELGFVHTGLERDLASTIQPRYQAVIYREDWQADQYAKLRYNLRQLERREVSVRKADPSELELFLRCIECTEARQAINLRDKEYFQRFLAAYPESAQIFLAEIDAPEGRQKAEAELERLAAEVQNCPEHAQKKRRQLEEQLSSAEKMALFFRELGEVGRETIAAGLLVHLGALSELPYAGTDEKYFNVPASWGIYNAVIEDAFQNGAERLNLGGIDGHFDDGLSRFKAHFNPRIEENYGEFNLPLAPLRARLFDFLMRMRQKFRKN